MNSTGLQNITVWGYSKIDQSALTPANIQETNYTTMQCRVIDEGDSSLLTTYPVSFWYKSSSASTYNFLGINYTQSSGWANYTFNLSHPKLSPISLEEKFKIVNTFEKYSSNLYEKHHFPENYFKVLDIAQRITSGTGSYGLKRYFILIQGLEEKWEQRILDMKMQEYATPCRFIPKQEYNKYDNNGERFVEAYKALSKNTDNHLGYILLDNKAFSIHERSPFKSYFPTQILNTATRFNKITQQWATITATAHLRAGTLFNPEKIVTNKEFPLLKKRIFNTAFEYEKYNASAYKIFIDKFFIDE